MSDSTSPIEVAGPSATAKDSAVDMDRARRRSDQLAALALASLTVVAVGFLVLIAILLHTNLRLKSQLYQCQDESTALTAQLASDAATHEALRHDFSDVLDSVASRWRIVPLAVQQAIAKPA